MCARATCQRSRVTVVGGFVQRRLAWALGGGATEDDEDLMEGDMMAFFDAPKDLDDFMMPDLDHGAFEQMDEGDWDAGVYGVHRAWMQGLGAGFRY